MNNKNQNLTKNLQKIVEAYEKYEKKSAAKQKSKKYFVKRG